MVWRYFVWKSPLIIITHRSIFSIIIATHKFNVLYKTATTLFWLWEVISAPVQIPILLLFKETKIRHLETLWTIVIMISLFFLNLIMILAWARAPMFPSFFVCSWTWGGGKKWMEPFHAWDRKEKSSRHEKDEKKSACNHLIKAWHLWWLRKI